MESFVRCFLAYTLTDKSIADYAKTLVPGRQVGLGISQGFYDDCKRLAIVVSRCVSLSLSTSTSRPVFSLSVLHGSRCNSSADTSAGPVCGVRAAPSACACDRERLQWRAGADGHGAAKRATSCAEFEKKIIADVSRQLSWTPPLPRATSGGGGGGGGGPPSGLVVQQLGRAPAPIERSSSRSSAAADQGSFLDDGSVYSDLRRDAAGSGSGGVRVQRRDENEDDNGDDVDDDDDEEEEEDDDDDNDDDEEQEDDGESFGGSSSSSSSSTSIRRSRRAGSKRAKQR